VTRSSHPPSGDARAPIVLQGIAGAPGVVVASVVILDDRRTTFQRKRLRASEVAGEMARVDAAVERAQASLVEISERVSMRPLGESRAILEAYLAMVRDPMLHDRIEHGIRKDRLCAEWAVASAADSIVLAFTEGLRELRDPYIEERKHDVEFVADKLLHALSGADGPAIRIEHPAIIVARDFSPADTAVMGRMPVLGFVTARGSSTSHTSIMARALHIPAVVGISAHELASLRTGDTVVLDGNRGVVVLYPDPPMVRDAQARAKKQSALAAKLRGRSGPSRSKCGTPLLFKANIELPEEVEAVMAMNADGIGLYRTEFMYINRKEPPSEQEQFEVFQSVVRNLDGRPVTLRTFDLGGDKFASAFALPEELNPALGLRAVRLALKVPDVLLTQLRAMVRASAEGPVRIMIPMVTTLMELRAVRALLTRACEQVSLPAPPLGMMVEVPAAALLADVFAKSADFFSIGTNDLVQYALAVDRTSRSVADLASPLDPSVLRLIDMVLRAGQAEGITTALCGQMAQDPLSSALLLGMGLRRFSIGGPALALVREALSRVTIAECEQAAKDVRMCVERSAVHEVLTQHFGPRLSDLYNT
jgi:phosphoenolpyruvate-protein phosphotransferase (PTS system enzyme I)